MVKGSVCVCVCVCVYVWGMGGSELCSCYRIALLAVSGAVFQRTKQQYK